MISEQLANHFNTVWVPEYARDYINQLQRPYNKEDILKIAKGQLKREKKLEPEANKYLFCDTEFIITKIWSEYKYKMCHKWILDKIKNHVYDLYLLMDIDLPWEYDPMREHPQLRKYFFDLYFNELNIRKFNFRVVNGLNNERLRNAIRYVKELDIDKN